ncbi:MAG TPA: hypothetical protein VK525_15030 [Candidatus Saccharimonadales bacterium]|nr:hypothetical protein [Candidatus Saccharimonadales bacterium]
MTNRKNIFIKKGQFSASLAPWIALATSVLSLVIGGGWFQEYQKSRNERTAASERLVVEYLQPIAVKLEDNENIYRQLMSESAEPGWGILESYLIKIKRSGVPKNALMKNRIDKLVANNEAILTLLVSYSGYVKTEDFRFQSAKFREHAILYSDRWKSLLEIFTSNGEFPTPALRYPTEFSKAVQNEISAQRH